MPHRGALPPEHEDSPASTFAPRQPAAGVVADDKATPEQNPGGGPTAAEATQADVAAGGAVQDPPGSRTQADEAAAKQPTSSMSKAAKS